RPTLIGASSVLASRTDNAPVVVPDAVGASLRAPGAAGALRRCRDPATSSATTRPIALPTGARGAAGCPRPGHDRIRFLGPGAGRLRAGRQGRADSRRDPRPAAEGPDPSGRGRADGFLIRA